MCRIIELLTEAAHRHVDHVALSLELSAPDAMEQLLPAEHPPGTPRECGQQVELTPAEVERSIPPPSPALLGVHAQPAGPELASSAPGALEDGAPPGRQSLEAKGLGAVMVSAGPEAGALAPEFARRGRHVEGQ